MKLICALDSQILQRRTCADLSDPPDPRWASWNLGIFVCIRYDSLDLSRVTVGIDQTFQDAQEYIVGWAHILVE